MTAGDLLVELVRAELDELDRRALTAEEPEELDDIAARRIAAHKASKWLEAEKARHDHAGDLA